MLEYYKTLYIIIVLTINWYVFSNINFLNNRTKLLESKQKELPEPKKTIIDYADDEYYDYDEDLDNKKEDDLVH